MKRKKKNQPRKVAILSTTLLPLNTVSSGDFNATDADLSIVISGVDPRDMQVAFSLNNRRTGATTHPTNFDIGQTPRTWLDLDLANMGINLNRLVCVTIVLTDSNAQFMGAQSSVLQKYAVTAGDQALQSGVMFAPLSGNVYSTDSVVQFYCKRTGNTGILTYNVGMIVSDTRDASFMLPIFLDPKIKNDG